MRKRLIALGMSLLMIISVVFPAAAGSTVKAGNEYDGYIYFTVEKVTLGQGFIVEPVKAGFYKDDTLADIAERVLGDKSTYEGDMASYYLTSIIDGGEPEGWSVNDIPAEILEAVGGTEELDGRSTDTELAVSDYYWMSGWMFSINNTELEAGAGSYKYNGGAYSYSDGDVVRLQYTVYGYGQDLNTFDSAWGMGDPLIVFPDKDGLIKAVADYNGDRNLAAYTGAVDVLADWDASVSEVAAALAALNAAENHAPKLASGVQAEAEAGIDLGGAYKIDLSSVFTDEDGDELTYTVSINGEKEAAADKDYSFAPEETGEYTLVFKADDGKAVSEEYRVLLTVSQPEDGEKVNVKITMNAVSRTMKLTDSEGNNVMSGEPENRVYELDIKPGYYVLTGFDSDGITVNGTVGINVTDDEEQSFDILTVTAGCSGAAASWVYGSDYTFENFNVQSGNGEKRTDISLGVSAANALKNTFLVYKGDTYGFWFTPSEELRQSYAVTYQTGTVTSNATKTISPALKYSLEVTVPYEDTDNDGVNDFGLEVGTLSTYYIYSYNSCVGRKLVLAADNSYGYDVEVLTFEGAKNASYFYRVSNPYNDDAVTYGDYVSISGDTSVDVTKEEMYIGTETDYDRDTVIDDLSVNKYDVADIYLNINAAGYLNLDMGDTFTLYPLRNWLAIEGISNAKVIEPDFHYTVLDENGNVSDDVIKITENLTDTTSRHSAMIETTGEGTAIVLVTYDAMTNAQGMTNAASTDRTFFSAIWPENTGVFVVTVGGESGIDTGMLINGSLNTTSAKLSGNAIDAEHDVLYYVSDEGAEYSFTPEAGVSVSVARPEINDSVSYSGFTDSQVTYNADGSVTLGGLTEGSNIVCIEKDGKTEYQVIRAKQVAYSVSFADADGNEIGENDVKAGDKVTIVFDTVYHPANKVSGYYNNTAQLAYEAEDGSRIKGTANQYLFAATVAAQTISFTIPKYWDGETYSLESGYLLTGGFGSAFGAHRSVTYEGGKPSDFTAVSNVSALGSLPAISIPLSATEFIKGRIVLKDSETDEIITGYQINIEDSNGNPVFIDDNGNISVLAEDFSYEIYADGYVYTTGNFTVESDTSDFTKTIKLAPASDGAWNGTEKTEPELINGFYQIGNGAELAWFAEHVNSAKSTDKTNLDNAVLTADIDMAGYPSVMIGASSTYPFGGVFDGNGKTVSGINISASSGTVYGLFRYVGGSASQTAVIKNVTVDGKIELSGSAGTVGSIAGYANKYSEISGCVSNVDIMVNSSASNAIVGGIVGYTCGNKDVTTKVYDCVNNGSITVNAAGSNDLKYVGGIIGEALYGSEVYNCINNGSIKGNAAYVGGIAGYQNATSSGASIIRNCANKADVNGSSFAGGITGYAYVNSASALELKIENCYNTGNVSAEEYSAGVIGYARGYSEAKPVQIINVYSAGNISGENAAAVIGYQYNPYFTSDCVYYLEGCCDEAGDTGEAKSSEELKTATHGENDILTLLGDAFDADLLNINSGYPVLLFENYITVNVSAYDYTAVKAGLDGASETGEIMDTEVTVVYGTDTADVILDAFAQAGVSITGVEAGYVTEINGLDASAGGGYSGWGLNYNNDDYTNYGMSYITLSDGDSLRFDYMVNADGFTDSVGNGWYGLPIVTEFRINGETAGMSRETSYDESWNMVSTYYINGEKTSSKGTAADPFVFELELPCGSDITGLEASFETSLDEHYRIIDGLEPVMDYSDGISFSLSSPGGKYVSYYEVKVSVIPENTLSDSSEEIRTNVLNYLRNTVKEPVISDVGGEWAVTGLARGGATNEEWYTGYYENVLESLKANGSPKLSSTKSTENSRVIIALTAIGADPQNMAGYNLLEPLSDFDYVVKQGINGAIYALIAFNTNDYEIPENADAESQTTRERLIEFILGRELENGGFAITGETADPDITAMVIQALAPYYDTDADIKAALDRAVETLSALQLENGGFGSWGEENSESCAQAVCALSALGINPDTDARFVKRGNSALDALLSYYDEASGGFRHTSGGSVNQMATEQAAYALDAYYRLLNGDNTLYDMSDAVKLYREPVPEESMEQSSGAVESTVESSVSVEDSEKQTVESSAEGTDGTVPDTSAEGSLVENAGASTQASESGSNVNTGDGMNSMVYAALMIIAAFVAAALVLENRRRDNR